MLRRCDDNMDLLEHFLRFGSLREVPESHITLLVTAHGINRVPRYQENRAASKSKLKLANYCLFFEVFGPT